MAALRLNWKDAILCSHCSSNPKLNKSNIAVNEILAYENEDLAVALGIRQAPTLVVIDGGVIMAHGIPSSSVY